MKKSYVSPSITTEMVEIGVFGCYGCNGNSGSNHGWGNHSVGNRHGHNVSNGHGKTHGGFWGFLSR